MRSRPAEATATGATNDPDRRQAIARCRPIVLAGRYARLVLERSHGNKREACRVLDISYHTLQAYLRFPMDREAGAEAEALEGGTSTCSEGPDEGPLVTADAEG
jgi:hypothetical protein